MSDPAIEAAQRATNGPINGPVGAFALAAAHEALKPIRKIHAEWLAQAERHDRNSKNARSYETATSQKRMRDLCRRMALELAPLIYTTEELREK